MTFTEQFKAERTRLNITQSEASEILEVSPKTITNWEAGEQPLAITGEGALARLKTVDPKPLPLLDENGNPRKLTRQEQIAQMPAHLRCYVS